MVDKVEKKQRYISVMPSGESPNIVSPKQDRDTLLVVTAKLQDQVHNMPNLDQAIDNLLFNDIRCLDIPYILLEGYYQKDQEMIFLFSAFQPDQRAKVGGNLVDKLPPPGFPLPMILSVDKITSEIEKGTPVTTLVLVFVVNKEAKDFILTIDGTNIDLSQIIH